MPLPNRQSAIQAIARQLQQQRRQRETVLLVDSDRGVQSHGFEDETVAAAALDLVQHYGFASNPPPDTELITDPGCAAGAVSIAERATPPQTVATGETLLYDASGNVVWCRKSTGIEIRVVAGVCKVRSTDSATTKAVALHQDNCTANDTFDVWAAAVEAGVAAAGGTVATKWAGGAIANVSATATKLEAE